MKTKKVGVIKYKINGKVTEIRVEGHFEHLAWENITEKVEDKNEK